MNRRYCFESQAIKYCQILYYLQIKRGLPAVMILISSSTEESKEEKSEKEI